MKDALKPKVKNPLGGARRPLSLAIPSPDAERFLLIGAMVFTIVLPLPISWLISALYPVPHLVKVNHLLLESQPKPTTQFCVEVETDRQICRDAKPLRPKRP